jgi:dTDP-glucose 4,6-dehydratase
MIEVYGKGKNIRTWLSVHDHADALIYISRKGKIGETYNISSRYKFSNIDIAKKIKALLTKNNIKTRIKLVIDRLRHDRQYSINANKLFKLGWRPKYQFDQQLKDTIKWYLNKNNLKFFKNVNKHLFRKGILK